MRAPRMRAQDTVEVPRLGSLSSRSGVSVWSYRMCVVWCEPQEPDKATIRGHPGPPMFRDPHIFRLPLHAHSTGSGDTPISGCRGRDGYQTEDAEAGANGMIRGSQRAGQGERSAVRVDECIRIPTGLAAVRRAASRICLDQNQAKRPFKVSTQFRATRARGGRQEIDFRDGHRQTTLSRLKPLPTAPLIDACIWGRL